MRLYADEMRHLDGPARRAFLRAKLTVVREIILRRDLFRGDRRELNSKAVLEANHAAGQHYLPGPYAGAAIIALTEGRVTAGPRNYRLDWLELVPQCGAPQYVPGRDTGDMLIPPNVYTLAARVNDWLEQAHADRRFKPQGSAQPGATDKLRAFAAEAPEQRA
jgi:hypothetical protein